jgi:hypothetical protein
MNHPTQEEWMEYLYSELDRDKETLMSGHLKECPQCSANVASWQSAMMALDEWKLPRKSSASPWKLNIARWMGKWATVAVFLVVAGYVGGKLSTPAKPSMEQPRLSAPAKPSMEQLRYTLMMELRPAIESSILKQIEQDFDELREVFLLSAELMDQRLQKFARDAHATRLQDRRQLNLALKQMTLEYLNDRTSVRDSMMSIAAITMDEIERSRRVSGQNQDHGMDDDLSQNKPKAEKVGIPGRKE